MEDQKEALHDEFRILSVFLFAVMIGMIVGLFYHSLRGRKAKAKQNVDSYSQVSLE